MGCLATLLVIIYFISPIDFWPGLIDDILCIIVYIFLCARSGINPYKKTDDDSGSEDE